MGKPRKIDYPPNIPPINNDIMDQPWEDFDCVSIKMTNTELLNALLWCRTMFGEEGSRWIVVPLERSSVHWLFEIKDDAMVFRLTWSNGE